MDNGEEVVQAPLPQRRPDRDLTISFAQGFITHVRVRDALVLTGRMWLQGDHPIVGHGLPGKFDLKRP